MFDVPNLLVTDDDSAFRQVLCEGLIRRGFQVTEACDGQEAIEVIDVAVVHVALIDVHMPRVDGLTVVRKLRQRRQSPPCLLMSADWNDESRQEAERMLAYKTLDKPVRLDLLTDIVCGALSNVYGWHRR